MLFPGSAVENVTRTDIKLAKVARHLDNFACIMFGKKGGLTLTESNLSGKYLKARERCASSAAFCTIISHTTSSAMPRPHEPLMGSKVSRRRPNVLCLFSHVVNISESPCYAATDAKYIRGPIVMHSTASDYPQSFATEGAWGVSSSPSSRLTSRMEVQLVRIKRARLQPDGTAIHT